MKDYRVLKRYSIDQWENDNEWMAARLDFIWCIRDYNPSLYLELNLNDEKEDFYSINNNEVARLASKLHYSVDMDYYKKLTKNMSLENQYSIFKKLREMKKSNLIQFIRKSNCNFYEYLKYEASDGSFYDIEKEEKYNQQFI